MTTTIQQNDAPKLAREAWDQAMAMYAQLKNLPYKVETNARGQLILTPRKVWHGFLRGEVSRGLHDHAVNGPLPPGRPNMGYGLETPAGIKAPDVAWISDERWRQTPKDAMRAASCRRSSSMSSRPMTAPTT